jgi:hypothetical protein
LVTAEGGGRAGRGGRRAGVAVVSGGDWRTSAGGWRERGEASEGGRELAGPRPVAVEVQYGGAGVDGEPAGDGAQPIATSARHVARCMRPPDYRAARAVRRAQTTTERARTSRAKSTTLVRRHPRSQPDRRARSRRDAVWISIARSNIWAALHDHRARHGLARRQCPVAVVQHPARQPRPRHRSRAYRGVLSR